jgi:uncharacterized protein involved in exopolysaccharide biosynthesis
MDFKYYFSLFLRRVHWFLLLVTMGTVVGITLARVLPPVYVSWALLVVENEQIPDKLAASTVQTHATEQLEIIKQRILSSAQLLDMAEKLQIYAPVNGRPVREMTSEDIVKDLRKRVAMITTGPDDRSSDATLVTISFEAPTATLAAAVANELVTMTLNENVLMRTTAARQTLDFFEKEVKRLDDELAKQGAAILAFKEGNLSALPDSLVFRRTQQAAAQERLLQLERDTNALRDRRDQLVLLYGKTGELAPMPMAQATPEQLQLQAQRENLANLLAVLSPENPRIALLKAQIAAAEKLVAEQMSRASVGAGGETLSPFQVQLADLDGQLAYLKTQKEQLEATMAELNASIEATPGNEITMGTLERDYANLRLQYDQAVASKARAETGSMIESLAKGQRISVIEPAEVPLKPARPYRILIIVGGAAIGLLLGLGVVVLLEVMSRTIRRPVEITNSLGITPLATLPYLRSAPQVRQRKIFLLFAFVLVLGAIPAGLWFIDTNVIALDQLIDRVLYKIGISSLMPAAATVAS